ncbi:MAG: winged helix-turn-helix transcriptional regulator [Candidatus Cloacimonetes bacterium]|nr:winged helix-turn-helix transcriptional regulator [Candidatus Cloacimonadota bacterium]MCA9785439.1 winged helix-turn-helix transcriptional regulator [Candidatus Cloacimonadota bacterium]
MGNKGGVVQKSLLRERARVFKALAHPVRLRLVEELRGGPVCVCELAALFPIGLPAISKHLGLLREAGVVAVRKEGTRSIHSLVMPCMLESFACIDRLILERLDEQESLRGQMRERVTA